MTTHKLFPHLDSPRLRLREITRSDTEQLFTLLTNPEAMEKYGSRTLNDLQEARDIIDWYNYQYTEGEGIRFGITMKPSNTLIGTCGVHTLDEENYRADLVCLLSPDHWQQGIMTEALPLLIDYAFAEMNLNRLQATVQTDNNASLALFRKLGFREEGVLREYHVDDDGTRTDMVMFGLLRRQWKAQG